MTSTIGSHRIAVASALASDWVSVQTGLSEARRDNLSWGHHAHANPVIKRAGIPDRSERDARGDARSAHA
jgi:hypothetical protein